MPRHFLEIHILQPFPLSCINRDDAGLPKTAPIGGDQRAYWSSQSQKRGVRQGFRKALGEDSTSVRTRRIPINTVKTLVERGREDAEAVRATLSAFAVLGYSIVAAKDLDEDAEPVAHAVNPQIWLKSSGRTSVVLPIANTAPQDLADVIEANWEDLLAATTIKGGTKADHAVKVSAELKKQVGPALRRVMDPARLVDVALFGRMLTEAPEDTVEAAASVAHAMTTHADESQADFWVATDDDPTQGHGGSANMGVQVFNSGLFYRYATVNTTDLAAGPLAADPFAARKGAMTFLEQFARLRPAAMEHRTAPYTDPSLVLVVASDLPRMFTDAFSDSVRDTYLTGSVQRLQETWNTWRRAYGDELEAFLLLAHPDVEGFDFDGARSCTTLDEALDRAMEAAFDA
ncbi:type I-E CRISPR-associated protein Cas7/Cse4/CasC [uncultured Kocuria sp.]|uniref:type I-E CRISPR-associated protein Cas7/Cse4/CasC n=1 Tax=uncultured Kocuria sp. TaxID=259305 RepID=UPI002626100D|nr:type I-E CRISPR-associated protein Cas7/Cse4/CasC [uncultured Kocuria sp.]